MNKSDALYRGWDADGVRERRDDDANGAQLLFSSSFTAINQQQSQLLTPQSSAIQPKEARRRALGTSKRRRNPTVAQYLGLGSSDEPAYVEKYAPLPDGPRSPPPKSARKRQKLGGAENNMNPMSTRSKTWSDPVQKRVSEGLRVMKPRSATATRSKTATFEASPLKDAPQENVHLRYGGYQTTQSPQDVSCHAAHNLVVNGRLVVSTSNATQAMSSYKPTTQDNDTLLMDLNTNERNTNGLEHSDCPQVPADSSIFDDEDFEDDFNDDELHELTSDMIGNGSSAQGPASSSLKVDAVQAQYPGSPAAAPITMEEISITQRRATKFVSPTTPNTRLLAAIRGIEMVEGRKPIARPPFPTAVRDRSPIIGLSSKTLLRTCFRVGEVINQAHQADRFGKHVIFEMYARVLDSERDDRRQHFTFCDLFHGKLPHLKAVYDAALWKSVELFNYDSKRLLQQGRIGRCTGTMKREGKEWVMTVLNIWEATWEDIEWVRGIANA